ncbi:Polyadenylation factor I complex, subunit, Yth1 (CPSF subunit), partial [Trachipleistophora hominis]
VGIILQFVSFYYFKNVSKQRTLMIRRMLVPTKLCKALLRFRTAILTDSDLKDELKDVSEAKNDTMNNKQDYGKTEEDELEEGEVYIKRKRVVSESYQGEKRLKYVNCDVIIDKTARSEDDLDDEAEKKTMLCDKKYFLYDSSDNDSDTEPKNITKPIKNSVNVSRQPIQTPQRRTDSTKQSNYRSQICRFFLTHSCTKGDACSYSHDIKRLPCKAFHMKKNCSRKNCMFSHEPISVAELNRMAESEKWENNDFVSPF